MEEIKVWPEKWPEPVLNRMKELWFSGLSAAECAEVLKKEFSVHSTATGATKHATTIFSRSSVIGKVHRMGLKRPEEEKRETRPKPKPKPKAEAPKPKPKPKPAPKPPRTPMPAEDIWKPTGEPVRLEDTVFKHCRWPVDVANGGESHWCCGVEKQEGSPYCADHTAIAWQPPDPKRKRDLMRLARRA